MKVDSMKRYLWLAPIAILAILLVFWIRFGIRPGTEAPAVVRENAFKVEKSAAAIPTPILEPKAVESATGDIPSETGIIEPSAPEISEPTAEPLTLQLGGRGAYRIRGTVISIAQAPVEGATVTCRPALEGRPGSSSDRTTRTGPGGHFEMAFRQPGTFELEAFKPPFARGSARVQLTMPGPEPVEIILRPGDVIQGAVRENLSAIPISGARVLARAEMEIYSSDEMRPQRRVEALSEADGSYLLEGLLPELSYSLIVSDGDHTPEQRGGIRAGGPAQNFFLNKGARISGRVIWEGDESPVEGATVSLGMNAGRWMSRTIQESAASFQMDSATTDASGAFTLGGLLTERRLPLFASYSESKTVVYRSQPQWIELRPGEHRSGVELVLSRRPPQRLHGVVRTLDRAPAAGAQISLYYGMGGFGRSRFSGAGQWGGREADALLEIPPDVPLDQTETAADGTYEFQLLIPGSIRARVEKKGFYGRAEGNDLFFVDSRVPEYRLDFVLFPGQPLSGTVRDAASGKPIARVALRLTAREEGEPVPWSRARVRSEYHAESGLDGGYEFSELSPGGYSLRVESAPRPYALPEKADAIAIEEKKPVVHDIALGEGVSLRGTVYYPDGSPASGAQLTGYILGSPRRLTAESNPVGSYTLTAFPIDSDVRIYVRPLNFPHLNPVPSITDRMHLTESVEDYELRIPAEGSARIKVQSSEEKPLFGQRVQVRYDSEDPLEQWDERLAERFTKERPSNRQGEATIDGLTPGSWRARIETRKDPVEGEFFVREAETAELTLTVPIESLVDNSGMLGGSVRFEDGTPAESVRIVARMTSDRENIDAGAEGSARTDREGRFRIRGLRLGGTFRVELRSRRATLTREGVVASNLDLEFVLPNSGGLSIRVVESEGDPPGSLWNAYLFRLEEGRERYIFEPPKTEPSSGLAQWESLAGGTYQVLIAGPDLPRGYSGSITVVADEMTETVEIRLPEAVDFSGEAVDASTLKGIAGVEVTELFPEGSIGSRWPQFLYQRHVFSDSVGDFLLSNLPPGALRLRLEHPLYKTQVFELGDVPNSETRILMEKKPKSGK